MKSSTRVCLHCLCVMFGVLVGLVAAGCGDDKDEVPPSPASPVFVEKVSGDEQIGETGRELPESIVVRAYDDEGAGIEGTTVAFTITGGGGTVSGPSAVTDSDGMASVRWTLGIAPVQNRLRASAGDDAVDFAAWANPGERPALELVFEGPAGIPSEDLAFEQGRGLFLGSPGAILNITAPGSSAVELQLTGEGVESPAGIAFGSSGDLYICENGESGTSVKRVTASGRSEILSGGFGSQPFALPNHMAVHSSGEIYVSSTCDQMIYRISPTTGETTEFLSIPGPNGLAFDAEEAYLYILTENPAFFCIPSPSVWGGLHRVSIGPGGEAGDLETLVDEFSLAGDGLAFDEEGNLYVVFSAYIELLPTRLLDSSVFVYTPDGRFEELFTVDILQGDIITNIAFGVEPFDPESLYCYGFTGRLYRVNVGIRGKPLP